MKITSMIVVAALALTGESVLADDSSQDVTMGSAKSFQNTGMQPGGAVHFSEEEIALADRQLANDFDARVNESEPKTRAALRQVQQELRRELAAASSTEID